MAWLRQLKVEINTNPAALTKISKPIGSRAFWSVALFCFALTWGSVNFSGRGGFQLPSSFEQKEYQVPSFQTMKGSVSAVECLSKSAKLGRLWKTRAIRAKIHV